MGEGHNISEDGPSPMRSIKEEQKNIEISKILDNMALVRFWEKGLNFNRRMSYHQEYPIRQSLPYKKPTAVFQLDHVRLATVN